MPRNDKEDNPVGGFKDLQGDRGNVLLLLLLYTLQGVPMGFAAAVPLILKERRASFNDIALFSVASLPFSAKLFWAPIVDSVYNERWGRRKTWLVPVQLSIGLIMIVIAPHLSRWLGEGGVPPDVPALTFVFFALFMACATQDIAVDGWALTMLKRRNVGYASTCNTIGQTLGYFEALVMIMAVVEPGYITLKSFTEFHGAAFIAITLLVALVKTEAAVRSDEHVEGIREVYLQMSEVVKLGAVHELIIVLLTWKFASAAGEAATVLKLQERGMPKEHAATLSMVLLSTQILVPMVVTRWTAGDRPLELAARAYLPKLLLAFFGGLVLVQLAPTEYFKQIKEGSVPVSTIWQYYLLLIVTMSAYSVASACMFVSQMAFFAKVSDPAIGGTYMTLLNTVANLGYLVSNIFVTRSIDACTWKTCLPCISSEISAVPADGDGCIDGEQCTIDVDGYFVMLCVCAFVGIVWWIYFQPKLLRLQELRVDAWRIVPGSRSVGPLVAILSIVFTMVLHSLWSLL